jgi:hypothetical protein
VKLLWNTEKPIGEIRQDTDLANLFPSAPLADLEKLAAAIAAGAVPPPLVCGVVGTGGMAPTGYVLLVDGHTRAAAYARAGKMPRDRVPVMVYQYASRAEMMEHAIILNAERRHLTTDQRAAMAVRLADLRKPTPEQARQQHAEAGKASAAARAESTRPTDSGARCPTAPPADPSKGDPQVAIPAPTHRTDALETAAKECGVGVNTARGYKKIQDSGTDDLRLAVRQRQLSIEAGAKIAALPAADQADALAVAIAAATAAKASRKTWRRERRQRAFAPGLAAAAPVRAGLVPALPPAALPPAALPPPTDLHALPPTSQVGDGEPSAGRLPVPPSLPPPVPAPDAPPPAPTLGHAAACETMCQDFAARLRRHLVMAKADHLPAPELDRCGAAVRALHLEVLRYLCLLNGASHPALLTDESLGRLADKKVAEFAVAQGKP